MKGNRYLIAILPFILCLMVVQAQAQDNLNVSCLNKYYYSWDDGVYDLAFHGYFGYLACGHDGLRIVGNPDYLSPGLSDFGHFDCFYATAVAVSGNYVYLGSATEGVYVIDISDPWAPRPVGLIPYTGPYGGDSFESIRIFGNYAFVCLGNGGVMIIDIADPSIAHVVHIIELYDVRDIEVHGNLAYLAATYNGFRIYDITDITSPQFLASYSCGDGEWVIDGTVSGNYAYLMCGGDGFRVIDLSTMQMVASIDSLAYGFRVKVSGNYAFATYGDPECPLAMIDISNPLAPQTLDIYYPPEDMINFQIIGDFIMAADYKHGLRQISILTNPPHLHESSVYNHYGHLLDIDVSGNSAYIRQENKISIVDISDVNNPFETSRYELNNNYSDLQIVGNVGYMVQDYDTCLRAIDISDPQSLNLLGSFVIPNGGGHYRIAVYDHYAYLLQYDGLRIIDIANPAAMQQVGYLDHDFADAKITTYGHYLFAQDRINRLLAFDLTNPTSPSVMNGRLLYERCRDMKADNGHLFVITNHTFWIFSATSFNTWAPIAEITLLGEPDQNLNGIDISGDYAYITGDSMGLCVYNISNLAAPQLVGHNRELCNPSKVALKGDIAIIADFTNLGFYDCSAATDIRQIEPALPQAFSLLSNYPNPFNGSTQIQFDLPKKDHVMLTVYDILGRAVLMLADNEFEAGRHTIHWDGTSADGQSVASGRYYVRAKTGEAVQGLPIMLLK